MVRLVVMEANGARQALEVQAGVSVMLAARNNDIQGIVGECGGCAACGTCHVYVDPAWFDRLPPADDNERTMLEYVLDPEPNSRLSCQITMTGELDGLVVRLPEIQY